MDYKDDVETDARDFMVDNEADFKEAIMDDRDFDRNDIEALDDEFHCAIIDRAYTLQDAAYIIENCENEETDSGLWEGTDARDMLSTIAAFSYGNDVWFKCEELYDELKSEYEQACEADEILANLNKADSDEVDNIDDELERRKTELLNATWSNYFKQFELMPIPEGSKEELEALTEWVQLGNKAGLWGSYPVGGSYIDSRCGTGHGMPEVKNFVDFDNNLGTRLPSMRGKYSAEVQTRIAELEVKYPRG